MSTDPASVSIGLRDPSVLVGKLTILGRRTGLPRIVEINLIYLNGKFYATSASVKNKHWCQNMIKNPNVEVEAGGKRVSCRSHLVTDEKLRQRVLQLRDSPPLLDRVVFEMSPWESNIGRCFPLARLGPGRRKNGDIRKAESRIP